MPREEAQAVAKLPCQKSTLTEQDLLRATRQNLQSDRTQYKFVIATA